MMVDEYAQSNVQAQVFEANPQLVDKIKETIREVVTSISQETLHRVVAVWKLVFQLKVGLS